MKRLLILALSMLLALLPLACQADEATNEDVVQAPSEAGFDDGGYTGAWVLVEPLGMEVFLPEGWEEDELREGESYAAISPDGATLGIALITDAFEGEDLETWVAENLEDDWQPAVANGQPVQLLRDDEEGELTVLVPCSGGRLISFQYTRASEDILSDELALAIAGTITDAWD